MADQAKSDAEKAAAEAAAKANEVEVADRHGKKIRLPLTKALELAGKGLETEATAADLKQRESALAKDERSFKQYREFQQHLSINRDAAKAVALALDDPRRVLELAKTGVAPDGGSRGKGKAADRDDADDEPERTAQADDSVRRDLDDLRAKVAERDAKDSAEALKAKIRGEMADYPWLKGKRAEIAYRQVLSYLQDDPNRSLSAAVAGVASEVKEAMEGGQEEQLAENERNARFRTERTGRGRPVFTPPEKITQEDLRNGNVFKEAMKMAKTFGFPV